MSNLYEQLQQNRLFSCLADPQIQEVAYKSSVLRLPDKSAIGLPSVESPVVHVLVTGRAKVCFLTRDGKKPILYFVNPDELIGEQLILHGLFGQNYIETIEPSLVANIPAGMLQELAASEPAFASGLSELNSRRRMLIECRIRHTMFLSNRERLTHLLLDLAEQYGSGPTNSLDIGIKLSHQDLANLIGSTRETVTVVLGKMQQEGLLNIRRRKITLCDALTLSSSVARQVPVLASSSVAAAPV